jgi:hypothetical protein
MASAPTKTTNQASITLLLTMLSYLPFWKSTLSIRASRELPSFELRIGMGRYMLCGQLAGYLFGA